MTHLDSFAIGATVALALVFGTLLPLASWVQRRRAESARRRAADAHVRAMLTAVVAGIHHRRPRGGFDMPPNEIAQKRMIETAVLGMPGGGISVPLKVT